MTCRLRRRASGATKLAVAVTVLVVGAAACSSGVRSGPSDGTGPGEEQVPAINAADPPLLPMDAMALPTFDFDLFQRLMDQLRGTTVLVNIWASWCGPCRAEAPHLAAANREHGTRLKFIGVDILDDRGAARAFMREFD